MKRIFFYSGFVTLFSMLLAACVTINIYFPAAAAEKVADKIIQKVWQLEGAEENGQDKGNSKESGQEEEIAP